MNQYNLIKEIIKTCKYFKVIDYEINDPFVEKKIIDGLEDIIFVENLLNIFYSKMKLKRFQKKLNQNRLKKLLLMIQ